MALGDTRVRTLSMMGTLVHLREEDVGEVPGGVWVTRQWALRGVDIDDRNGLGVTTLRAETRSSPARELAVDVTIGELLSVDLQGAARSDAEDGVTVWLSYDGALSRG